MVTSIPTDHRRAVWKDNTSLYVPQNDGVVEVRIDSGKPEQVKRIPIEKDAPFFYGIFNGQPLIQNYNRKIELGTRTLVELDRDSTTAVVTTRKYIFVAASAKTLVAFDTNGRELCRTNPGRVVGFGSVGGDPNTVYGLTGSTLLRVFIENKSLNIEEVCDLGRL
jgi:hypothetical protein